MGQYADRHERTYYIGEGLLGKYYSKFSHSHNVQYVMRMCVCVFASVLVNNRSMFTYKTGRLIGYVQKSLGAYCGRPVCLRFLQVKYFEMWKC